MGLVASSWCCVYGRSCLTAYALLVTGVSKIYVAGAKIAAAKRLLAPHSPVRSVTLARKARGEQSS